MPVPYHGEHRVGLARLVAEPVQLQREHLDEDQPEEEDRHRVDDERQAGHRVVADRVAADRLVDAERDRDHHRKQQRHAGQVGAARPPFLEQRDDVLVELVGVAEIALH